MGSCERRNFNALAEQLVEDVGRDLRLGVRMLTKNPGFTAIAVMMLALGIAVNATVFTVTNAVLFKGFPLVERNDRLRYIGYQTTNCCVSYLDFLDWRAQSKSFSGMAIVHGVGLTVSDAAGFAESLNGNENSADTFRIVGQQPILGRDFTADDEKPGALPVAILNYGFWERRYAKDPSIVGKTIRLNGAPTTLIGVMPKGFSFPQVTDVWVPLVQTPSVLKRGNRNTWMVIGRLADGVTAASASAEMEMIGKRLAIAYPQTNRDLLPHVQTFTEFFIGPNGTLIYGSMWGAVGFVLLIACANLANLLLVRAIGRSREISVRIALGAGRWRIIRQLLIESVMLSGLGGFIGWWMAKWGVRTYELAMARKSSWLIVDYTMDLQVLGYLVAISLGTGILFGLAPALRLSKLDVNTTLKDGGRGATSGGQRNTLSALLVAGEMALAIVLLAGAGVMVRSFLKIHAAEIGIDTGSVLAGSVNLPLTKVRQPRAEDCVLRPAAGASRSDARRRIGGHCVGPADVEHVESQVRAGGGDCRKLSAGRINSPASVVPDCQHRLLQDNGSARAVGARIQSCRCRVASAGCDREPRLRRQVLAGRGCAREAVSLVRRRHAWTVGDRGRRRVEHHSERPDPADVRAARVSAVSAEAWRRRLGVCPHAHSARELGVGVPPRGADAGCGAAGVTDPSRWSTDWRCSGTAASTECCLRSLRPLRCCWRQSASTA